MTKWISVKERLPEEDEYVLVFLGDREMQYVLDMSINQIDGQKRWSFPDKWVYITDSDVTHWMPLPPPPNSFEDLCNKKHPAT